MAMQVNVSCGLMDSDMFSCDHLEQLLISEQAVGLTHHFEMISDPDPSRGWR